MIVLQPMESALDRERMDRFVHRVKAALDDAIAVLDADFRGW